MPLVVATHSGPFHADDVLAVALVRSFVDSEAVVVRSRVPADIEAADIAVDVGGVYDPARCRFDHHQKTYTGPLSSAGMVLTWLEGERHVPAELAARLRSAVVDYIDDVDTGRVAPRRDVPCLPRIVEALNAPAGDDASFLEAFEGAVAVAMAYVRGLRAEHAHEMHALQVVRPAMDDAVAAGRNVVIFDAYLRWKPVYFAYGGEEHPTEFTLFPGVDGSWRVVAIPPRLGDFGQKRSLPASWAGLSGAELEAAVGVPGAMFCHKNRFIAVFRDREAAEAALRRYGLWTRPAG